MAEKATRGWSERVREVQDLLRRFKLVRSRLEQTPAASHEAAPQRAGLEGEARSLHGRVVRSARGLIADAGHLSPKRVHFDADQKQPGALRTHENETTGRLDWSMVFGPSALSRSGKTKTVGVVDGLRRRLAGERRSAKERRGAQAHAEPIDLAQRWSWLPNLERLDRWSDEFLARFDRSLAWFGLDLAQRFEPATHDGFPDLVFEEPGLGALGGGVAAGAAAALGGIPASIGGAVGAVASAVTGAASAAGGRFPVGGGAPALPAAPSSGVPGSFPRLPSAAPGVASPRGGASRVWPSLPLPFAPPHISPPIPPVRMPTGNVPGATPHPIAIPYPVAVPHPGAMPGPIAMPHPVAVPHPSGRVAGWPIAAPGISPARPQFVPRWLGGAPIPSVPIPRREQAPSMWPQPIATPPVAWPSPSGRAASPPFGPVPMPSGVARVPWLRPGLGGAPVHRPPSMPALRPPVSTPGAAPAGILGVLPGSGSVASTAAAAAAALAGTPAAVASRAAGRGLPGRAPLPGRSTSKPASPSWVDALEPTGIPALVRQLRGARPTGQRSGTSPISAPAAGHVVPPGGGSAAAVTPPHAAIGAKMHEPIVAASAGAPRRGPLATALASILPALAAPATPFAAPLHLLDRFFDAPRSAPKSAGRPHLPRAASPLHDLVGPIAAALGGEAPASDGAARPPRRGMPLPGMPHTAPGLPGILESVAHGLAPGPISHIAARAPRGPRLALPHLGAVARGLDAGAALAPALPLHGHGLPNLSPANLVGRLLAPAVAAPHAGARWPAGVRDFVPTLHPMLDALGKHATAAPLSGLARLPGFADALAGRPSIVPALPFGPSLLTPLLGGHAPALGAPIAGAPTRGVPAPAQPARLAPLLGAGARDAAHRWPALAATARPEIAAMKSNAHTAARDGLMPLVSRLRHEAPVTGIGGHAVAPSTRKTDIDATPKPAASARSAVRRPIDPAALAAAATSARPSTRPHAADLPAFLEPLAAAAGHAGVGPRGLSLPTGVPAAMPAFHHVIPSAVLNPDRLIDRVPTIPHIAPMLRALRPGVLGGAPRIPGLSMPALNIPRLAALSGAPVSTERPEPAMLAAAGATAAPAVVHAGHAAFPEMSYVILGSRNRGPSMAERAARVITETRFVEPPPERERDYGGGARILKASVGRDHRPQPSGGVGKEARETSQGAVGAPDLDRLAAQIYGRIKQRLAIDRERRGFVR